MKFEKALSALEGLVGQLEEGDLPLDDALKAFEKGIKLTRECQQQLTLAEQKVQMLLAAEEGEEGGMGKDDQWQDLPAGGVLDDEAEDQ